MPRTALRARLQPLGVFLALLLVSARPPDDTRAVSASQALVAMGAGGAVDARDPALRELVQPANLPAAAAAQEAWYGQLAQRLAPGTPLQQAMAQRPPVLTTVRGPDYTRVVFDTAPALTVVTRREGGAVVVDRVERSACAACSEPERFVADLIAQVERTGDADARLVLGVELHVTGELAEDARWRGAMHVRNTRAGYLRWLLHGAEVLGAEEEVVRVALRPDGGEPVEERWPIVWERDRWMLDYDGLSEDSLLRLDPEEVSDWYQDAKLAVAILRYWTPRMLDGPDGLLVADDVLFAAPRPGGDLILYVQDIGRTAAFILQLDPDSGEVRRRARLPTLSRRVGVIPETWGQLFQGALSPSGERLALAAHDSIWLVDLNALALSDSLRHGPAVRSLAWSPDGQTLAIGDERGAVSLLTPGAEPPEGPSHWPQAATPVHALLWPDSDRVVAVWEDGRVGELRLPTLEPGPLSLSACCGAVRGAALDPRTGELVVGCAGACDPAFLWTSELLAEDEPEVLADLDFRADAGTVSVDPDGRYRLTPSARPEGHAALWDVRSGELVAVFAQAPLAQVAWEDDRLWAVDIHGRLWRWDLAALVGG